MRRALVAAAAVLGCVLPTVALTSAPAGAASARSGLRAPVTSFGLGNPGILRDGGRFLNFFTGRLGRIAVAPEASGPWVLSPHAALTRRPSWTSTTNLSYWAPSATKLGTGRYVLFFSAVRRNSSSQRCIGTGFATRAGGPYTPRDTPLACPGGQYGAPDHIPGVASENEIIDATPRYLTVNGGRGLYLTYKTQHPLSSGGFYSTIRMVRLNISTNARTILGTSHQLTSRTGPIEENPVLVQRAPNDFTLFTSVGGYTLCSYHTEWRHSSGPWSWPQSSHPLSFPAGTNTCGTGDADVYPGLVPHSWRIFFSGRYPSQANGFFLYVGTLVWSGSTPRVFSLLDRAR